MEKTENLQTAGLKGKVKRLTRNNRNYDSSETYEYNTLGNLISKMSYDGNDKLVQNIQHEYDHENLLKQTVDCTDNSKDSYHYDDHNRLIQTLNKDKHNQTISKSVFEYQDHLLLKQITKNNFGLCSVYEYDSEGRLLRETESDCDGNCEGITEYQYDPNGLLILEKNYDDTGEFSYSIAFNYNDKGDVAYQKMDNEDSDEIFFEYEYDDHNNWIRQWSIINGNKSLEQEREIIYY